MPGPLFFFYVGVEKIGSGGIFVQPDLRLLGIVDYC